MSITDIVAEDPKPNRLARRAAKSARRTPRGSTAPDDDLLDGVATCAVQPPAAAPLIGHNGGPPLADDILRGVREITLFIYGKFDDALRHKVYRLAGTRTSPANRLPTFKLGDAVICARKSTILRWIERQEAAAVADDEERA